MRYVSCEARVDLRFDGGVWWRRAIFAVFCHPTDLWAYLGEGGEARPWCPTPWRGTTVTWGLIDEALYSPELYLKACYSKLYFIDK